MASEITSSGWYDASEGDEFFLDANDNSLASETEDARQSDVEEEEEVEEEVADEYESSAEGEPEAPPQAEPTGGSSLVRPETTVVRRTKLLAPTSGEEGSLFSVLKKNVGKVCSCPLL